MKLVRLAVISVETTHSQELTACALAGSDGIETHLSPVPELMRRRGKLQVIAKSFATLPPLTLDSEGFLSIPDESRRLCEAAIARAAVLLAINMRGRRQVVSGTPPAAFIPENEDDSVLLGMAVAIRAGPPQPLSSLHTPIDLRELTFALSDRWDGAAVLAEAYSHTSLSGRYRDFVRLFELAFTRAFTEMEKKLAQTLLPAMGYSVSEVREWQALRHPFSHADGKITKVIALDRDARPVFQRMEQAAWDILLNKAEWRKWSSARRHVWVPEAITTDRSGRGVVRQGSGKVTVEWLMLDEFGVFPRVLELQHVNLPPTWWHRFVPTTHLEAEE
jgi:hypothetical protein